MARENKFAKALQQAKEKDINNNINDKINNSINNEINNSINNEINNNMNVNVDFTNLFKKKKKIEKILVNFTLKEDTYKRLITLAEKNNLTLTEVVETTLDAMLDANKIKINEKAVESFKAKNERRGRPRKERK